VRVFARFGWELALVFHEGDTKFRFCKVGQSAQFFYIMCKTTFCFFALFLKLNEKYIRTHFSLTKAVVSGKGTILLFFFVKDKIFAVLSILLAVSMRVCLVRLLLIRRTTVSASASGILNISVSIVIIRLILRIKLLILVKKWSEIVG
jgi:hypothetical protein